MHLHKYYKSQERPVGSLCIAMNWWHITRQIACKFWVSWAQLTGKSAQCCRQMLCQEWRQCCCCAARDVSMTTGYWTGSRAWSGTSCHTRTCEWMYNYMVKQFTAKLLIFLETVCALSFVWMVLININNDSQLSNIDRHWSIFYCYDVAISELSVKRCITVCLSGIQTCILLHVR